MFSYTVKCSFTHTSVAADWLGWLLSEHVEDVLQSGARSAEIFRLDGDLTYEIRYRFDSREDFEKYESEHAPRLREDGLVRFPLEKGLEYSRCTGQSIAQFEG